MTRRTLLIFWIIANGILLCVAASVAAAERDVTLQWEHSIDYPYLQYYRIYYYTSINDPNSLAPADYATTYTLAGGSPIAINSQSDPIYITIDKENTQITLHFTDGNKIYFYRLTAIDTRGLESVPSREIPAYYFLMAP